MRAYFFCARGVPNVRTLRNLSRGGRGQRAFEQRGGHRRGTSALTGRPALKMSFGEMSFVNEFDGIWACASLLHVPRSMLPAVLCRLERALKPGGHLYLSFKYGGSERIEAGRFFNDLNEKLLRDFVGRCSTLQTISTWRSQDRRPGSSVVWLNAIGRRIFGGTSG
jgi:hypothetical protein